MKIIPSIFFWVLFPNSYHVLLVSVYGENYCLDNYEQEFLANRRFIKASSFLSLLIFDPLVSFITEVSSLNSPSSSFRVLCPCFLQNHQFQLANRQNHKYFNWYHLCNLPYVKNMEVFF